MVAVGMGDQNMGHGFAAHGIQQRRRMGLVVGAGIDDRDLALADDVTHRAGEGERARIVAENPPHAGADFLDDAGLKRKVAVERDVVVIGHGVYPYFDAALLPSCPRAGSHVIATSRSDGGQARHAAILRDARRMRAPRDDDRCLYENAWMPVMARPRIRAWTSWVPS